jgi:hypothetical protein
MCRQFLCASLHRRDADGHHGEHNFLKRT